MTRSQTAMAAAAEAAAASAVAERLPEEIIDEILSRLPAKSLIRFRCVCKWWRSLISDRGFAKSHLQRLKARDMVSSQRIVKSDPIETIDYEAFDGGGADGRMAAWSHDLGNDDPRSMLVIVGSCDGLVCFEVWGGFFLYNPTTGESRNVPISDLDLIGEGEFFNGFGYDPAVDDYKIVHAYYYDGHLGGVEDPGMWRVAIFSLKSGSWRRMEVQLDIHPRGFHGNNSGLGFEWHKSRRGICWNGALHWCLEYKELNNRGFYDSGPVIVSFNLSEDKFHEELPVPKFTQIPTPTTTISIVGLGIHGANLLMYVGTPTIFMAWIMRENTRGGSWKKLSRSPSRTQEAEIVFELGSSEMILFNPKREWGNVELHYPTRAYGGSAIYIEIFVSPYLGCEPSRI
ncbi:hypothetical protein ACJRO7_000032 [Eucalyptus globulus]|uniref:F-box domain-containing protein n=1 Tax=Eucalyptus globulus TaxID=34317 RepID=A0ABD3LL88_EUCGL